MSNKNNNRFVDELLEASLSRYSSVTPRPGLEARVLAHTRAVRGRRAWFAWAGLLAAGAAVAVIAIGVLKFSRKQEIQAVPNASAETTATIAHNSGIGVGAVPKLRTNPAARPSPLPARRGEFRGPEEDPQMAVFPSPHPATAEEKLLRQYVRLTPPSVLAASPAYPAKIPDLKIKDLNIRPLDSQTDELNNNDE
jgi:hypothetical protein